MFKFFMTFCEKITRKPKNKVKKEPMFDKHGRRNLNHPDFRAALMKNFKDVDRYRVVMKGQKKKKKINEKLKIKIDT